ncbi:MAG: DUF5615 family PIN-like protein [Nitrococcus sp.]|nr:DUF5615 family PIN-like protein [Nitrococcus sp.]
MNLSPRWCVFLAGAGFDAIHWSALGCADASDTEIMAFAAEHEDVVLTNDLDFSAILAATQGGKPSGVQIRADSLSPDTIGQQVVNALRQGESDLKAGALLTVEPGRSRLRILPLSP